jgi:hypothetical protein
MPRSIQYGLQRRVQERRRSSELVQRRPEFVRCGRGEVELGTFGLVQAHLHHCLSASVRDT